MIHSGFIQAAGKRALLRPFDGQVIHAWNPRARLQLSAEGKLLLERDGRRKTVTGDPLQVLEELTEDYHSCAIGWMSYESAQFSQGGFPLKPHQLNVPLFDFCWYNNLEWNAVGANARVTSTGDKGLELPRPLWNRSRWLESVGWIKEQILAGEVYQVNLVQPFHARCGVPPFQLFEDLGSRSQPDFGACIEHEDYALLSLSPEMFLKKSGDRLQARPMKGTCAPGAGAVQQLLDSSKDRAELAMIVDLLRNDLGRISQTGSVKVVAFPEIVSLPSVVHSQARIESRLKAGVTFSEQMQAMFPCGSISGCPKIAAMQHIDRLESEARGPSMGAIGWLKPGGDYVFSVAIRSALIQDDELLLHAGGGITIDSDPQEEYLESLQKVKAFASAYYDSSVVKH